MRYTVAHRGVPVGVVELEERELSAGPMATLPAYAALRDVVRHGSEALLALGFFGAAVPPNIERPGELALKAAAGLRFDLVDGRGDIVPTSFVNLIEPPDEAAGQVVVIARFREAHAPVPARVKARPGEPGSESRTDT